MEISLMDIAVLLCTICMILAGIAAFTLDFSGKKKAGDEAEKKEDTRL